MKSVLILCVAVMFSQGVLANSNCKEDYIPPHTEQDLFDVQEWAGGGAFAIFAKDAGYNFDRETYIADCPNWAIFGFGKALGPVCTQNVDLLSRYISLAFVMERKLEKDPEEFPEYYYEMAKKYGFDIYLSKPCSAISERSYCALSRKDS